MKNSISNKKGDFFKDDIFGNFFEARNNDPRGVGVITHDLVLTARYA